MHTKSPEIVTNALREAKAAYYKAQFESVKHDPKEAWKTANKILIKLETGMLRNKVY
jgi:hypothetical protein